ncbi:MAG: sigma-70 family RNA polymerase sigma factor [Candidatus Omnitrophica bacterium]|nr:sigma-70 family RNA polymerase sigma factor [Candidatus Omnitrophota bacterium]
MKQDPRVSVKDIFEQYHRKVYYLALSIVRNDTDAQDVTQNAFIKIIKNLKTFRGDSRLSTWVYRIAYNESLMYLRKKSRQARAYAADEKLRTRSGAAFVNWSRLPDKALLDRELRQKIQTALSRIPIQYRIPLELHHAHEMPLKEISGILNIGIGSLKSRLHRSYLMVASEIGRYFQDMQEFPKAQEHRCGLLTDFVYAYARGTLQKGKRKGFDRHISDCPECRLFLDRYAQALRVSGSLECRDLPAGLKEKISRFVLGRKK